MKKFTLEQTFDAVIESAHRLEREGHDFHVIVRAMFGTGASMLASDPADPQAIPTLETATAELQKILGAYYAATRPKTPEH